MLILGDIYFQTVPVAFSVSIVVVFSLPQGPRARREWRPSPTPPTPATWSSSGRTWRELSLPTPGPSSSACSHKSTRPVRPGRLLCQNTHTHPGRVVISVGIIEGGTVLRCREGRCCFEPPDPDTHQSICSDTDGFCKRYCCN